MARKYTSAILEGVEEGWLDSDQIMNMCLKAMSEDDVERMCKANEIDKVLFDDFMSDCFLDDDCDYANALDGAL
jgi:hypothetical protein